MVIRNNITSELVKKHLNREAEEHKTATAASNHCYGPEDKYLQTYR